MMSARKRINIVLPEATIRTIDRMAMPGERSRFIDQAVRHYVANQSAEALPGDWPFVP
jgi:metal-responsive CopG/Arc/MetJ family transcriptional regulator